MADFETSSKSLFALLSAETDGEAYRAMGRATSAAANASMVGKFLKAALPLETMIAGGMFVSHAPIPVVAAKVLVGAGATVTAAHYLDIARHARALARLERQFAGEGEWEVALYVAGARTRLLDLLPNSQTRSAAVAVNAVMYAARCDSDRLMEISIAAAHNAVQELGARAQQRIGKYALQVAELLEEVPSLEDRARMRCMLVDVVGDIDREGIGELAVEAGIEMGMVATDAWAMQSRSVDTQFDAETEMVTISTGGWETEDDANFDLVNHALDSSKVYLAAGFSMISRVSTSTVADAWARKLIREELVPTGVVLEAYGMMLQMTDDDRLADYEASLAEPDPERGSALKFLGLTSEAPGPETPGL